MEQEADILQQCLRPTYQYIYNRKCDTTYANTIYADQTNCLLFGHFSKALDIHLAFQQPQNRENDRGAVP